MAPLLRHVSRVLKNPLVQQHGRNALFRSTCAAHRWSSSDDASSTVVEAEAPLRGPAAATEVLERCAAIHARDIAPLNELIRGPLERSDLQQQTMLPFVLLLGNHSSGKSSFANFALGRDIQTAGVAPTDDSFTVISPGPTDFDRDGPSLVSDPDLGFTGLRSFGPGLTHHMSLKIRSNLSTSSFMIVDSPGMIDAPSPLGQKQKDDRGYHFEGAVRWFAERADVILLFFDPDKPGTTGETLSILTSALQGTDHKLHIILNKADRFERMHDFARAYGALCWNLAKVIPRKDLPRIYTMCLPNKKNAFGETAAPVIGLEDLAATREEVLAEVRNAPARRVDNTITRLLDAAQLLLMHAEVCSAVRDKALRKQIWLYGTSGSALGGALLGSGLLFLSPLGDISPTAVALFAAAGIGGSGLLHFLSSRATQKQLEDLASPRGLEATYEEKYARALADRDDESAATWRRVKRHIDATLDSVGGAANAPRASRSELAALRRIVATDAPLLRRKSAPMDFKLTRRRGHVEDN